MQLIEKMATQDEFEEIRNLAQKIVNKVFKINSENIITGKERDFSEINGLINQFRILLKRKGEVNIQKDNNILFEETIRPLHIFQIKRSA